jgi:hypothetical protein
MEAVAPRHRRQLRAARRPAGRRLAPAAAAAMLACAGCGIKDPYASSNPQPGGSAAVRSASSASLASSASVASSTSSTATTVTTITTASASTASISTGAPDPAPTATRMAPVPAGRPGSAYNVAYRFALAYANVSAATVAPRLRTMIALATPAYARALQRGAGAAQAQAARGLAPGAQMVGRVLSIQLAGAQGTFEHGAVTLQLAMRRGTTEEQPFTSTDSVDLLRSGDAWRVADFGGQS